MHAHSYIRSNACKKGEPNLTTGMFSEWVNKEYNQSISTETQEDGSTHLDLVKFIIN